ncbi:PepSY domain-containing protein [Edaphobacter modestus]|uniref:PepSY-associated transmembrane protein n=1 Tax=Edaphobacter modestus TaxID=388466 RepID=A0A4Q7Z0P6_9BACT|nr:PepSY domain-containing protein [Edaphobacter modestus]RZU43678.1 hypothetical protein BDD14_5373 [Edaphobacter modestus]
MGMPIAALKVVRLIHLYLGVFIAPAIVFFAFTGALQTLSLHESSKGSTYKPAHWIIVLAQLHKKQTTERPASKVQQPATSSLASKAGGPERTGSSEKGPAHHPLSLKIFFLVVSVGLFASTATGLYMSYKYCRRKVLLAIVFIAGIVVPICLTLA